MTTNNFFSCATLVSSYCRFYVLVLLCSCAIFFLFQDIFLAYGKKVVRGEKSKWWLLQFLSTKKWDIYVILASLIFLCLKNMKTAYCLNLDCKIFNWKLEHFSIELLNFWRVWYYQIINRPGPSWSQVTSHHISYHRRISITPLM